MSKKLFCIGFFSFLSLFSMHREYNLGTFSMLPYEIIVKTLDPKHTNIERTSKDWYSFSKKNRKNRVKEKAKHDIRNFIPFRTILKKQGKTVCEHCFDTNLEKLYYKTFAVILFSFQTIGVLDWVFKENLSNHERIISNWHIFQHSVPPLSSYSLVNLEQIKMGQKAPVLMIIQYQNSLDIQTFESLIKETVKYPFIQKIDIPNYSLCDTHEKIDQIINILKNNQFNGLLTFNGDNTTLITLCCNGTLSLREDQFDFFLKSNPRYATLPAMKIHEPLLDACSQKNLNLSVIKKLLEHGADPNIKDRYIHGFAPLHLICSNMRQYFYLYPPPFIIENNSTVQNVEIKKTVMHELLKHGANPNMPDNNGCRPAHHICCKDDVNIDFLLLLVKYGADLSLTNRMNQIPLNLIRNKKIKQKVHKQLKLVSQKGTYI